MSEPSIIRPRDQSAILQSLRAGVVPRRGFQHIQVGRAREVESLTADLEQVADGGSAFRFVVGEYGSGKTFYLCLIRQLALAKRLVAAQADLTPDRRLHGTGGQARTLYSALMQSLATRAKEDGGALASVVERFIATAVDRAQREGRRTDEVISERLAGLSEMVGGYDFAEVVAAYRRGYDQGDEALQSSAVRWLRGEFGTKTEARQALGVRTIVDDDTVYDQLKLMASFVRQAGYAGLLVCLDELKVLHDMAHRKARDGNYEQLLRMFNDCLQGSAEGLGFVFGITPAALTHTGRGVFSYPALAGRLAENRFAGDGLVDFSGPVLRLANLTPEDVFVLLGKLRQVHAGGDPAAYRMDDRGLQAFMAHSQKQVGEAYFRSPRNTIRSFLDLLAVLDQNPEATWQQLIGEVVIATDAPDATVDESDDEFATYPG